MMSECNCVRLTTIDGNPFECMRVSVKMTFQYVYLGCLSHKRDAKKSNFFRCVY